MMNEKPSSTAGFQPVGLLARAELLEHAKHPRNRGALETADMVSEEANPLCGDVVTVYAALDSGADHRSRITRLSFTGHGCLISQAAASMLTEYVVGKSVEEFLRMGRGDMERLLGGVLSPSRVKCAMLPLLAVRNGLARFSHAVHP
ncbi:MAG: nitrogen fixation protein NifU [Parcubacteria group bacterium Gr01-1014_38]|nr:MAG: nitrogen fixation protein NifU [Parcubacteria group bacterium Gr01-1014_38]